MLQKPCPADQITRISGIVNGTCNFILSRMESGASYATALADAQGLGYAEADPSADVDGFDARAKLCILSRVAMHAELDPDQLPGDAQMISAAEAVDFAYAKELELHDSAGVSSAVGGQGCSRAGLRRCWCRWPRR